MNESRSKVLKYPCVCKMIKNYDIRSAPGQRDIDWDRVGKLSEKLKEDTSHCIRLQPIYVFVNQLIIYIIDGQHRYHAHVKLCENNIHRPIEILYEAGDEKDAAIAYDLQLMAVPQPPTQGLSISDKHLFSHCVNYLRGISGDLAFESDGKNTKKRPKYIINDLVKEYLNVFPESNFEDFKTHINNFNLYLKKIFDPKKFKLTGDTNIFKIEKANIYYGILHSEEFSKYLSIYKLQI